MSCRKLSLGVRLPKCQVVFLPASSPDFLPIEETFSKVAVVDLNTQRLTRAEQLGAYRTQTHINKLLEEEPLGFDCVIDVTGVARAMEGAFAAVKRGGKFMVFGVAPQEARMSLSPFRIYNDEIAVLGSMAILFSYGSALDLISGGVIEVG